MSLIRSEPFASLQTDIDRLVDSFWGTPEPARRHSSAWAPAMDVRESEGEYVLSFDVPGLKPDEVTVELDRGRLTVSGERTRESVTEGERVHRFERQVGSFTRTISLPQGVDDEKIEAEQEDGVLTVRVPKPEQPKPKRIPVGVGLPDVDGEVGGEARRAA